MEEEEEEEKITIRGMLPSYIPWGVRDYGTSICNYLTGLQPTYLRLSDGFFFLCAFSFHVIIIIITIIIIAGSIVGVCIRTSTVRA